MPLAAKRQALASRLNARAQPGNVHDLARDLQSLAVLTFSQ
jgi:hypothetical protein